MLSKSVSCPSGFMRFFRHTSLNYGPKTTRIRHVYWTFIVTKIDPLVSSIFTIHILSDTLSITHLIWTLSFFTALNYRAMNIITFLLTTKGRSFIHSNKKVPFFIFWLLQKSQFSEERVFFFQKLKLKYKLKIISVAMHFQSN